MTDETYQWTYDNGYEDGWLAAIEAAAKACDKISYEALVDDYGAGKSDGCEQCVDAIRALEIT